MLSHSRQDLTRCILDSSSVHVVAGVLSQEESPSCKADHERPESTA